MADPATAANSFETITYTTNDGLQLQARRFPQQGNRLGRLLLLHGIQSHSGWYLATCQALSQAGYEVLFVDRRG